MHINLMKVNFEQMGGAEDYIFCFWMELSVKFKYQKMYKNRIFFGKFAKG